MFRDLQKGYAVNILDKTGSVPVYKLGTVVSVSAPRFENKAQPAGFPPQFSTERVVDLTVETDGTTLTYVVPETWSMASSTGVTLACDSVSIASELRSIIKRSKDALAATDNHKATIEQCETLLSQIEPSFAQNKEQNERMNKVESSLSKMEEAMTRILSMLAVPSESRKEQQQATKKEK